MSEVDRIAKMLIAEWERVEGEKVNVSYVATFVDMARVVVKEIDDARLDARSEGYNYGYEQGQSDGYDAGYSYAE